MMSPLEEKNMYPCILRLTILTPEEAYTKDIVQTAWDAFLPEGRSP